MIFSWYSLSCGICVVACAGAIGCHRTLPLPLPDAAPRQGLTLTSTPSSLVIRPDSSGQLNFALCDANGTAVPAYPIDFAVVPDASQIGVANVRLSSSQSLTDDQGSATLELIIGDLLGANSQSSLIVQATAQGSAPSNVDVTVTANTYSVEILPTPVAALVGSSPIVATRVQFYDDSACANFDLTTPGSLPKPLRQAHVVTLGTSSVFLGVAAVGSHAVVGLGQDKNGAIQIVGCVDVPGPSLLDSETLRATLVLNTPLPVPRGSYDVVSTFTFQAPLATTATIEAAWQQWTRCPLDPARLWIDCTIDALASDSATDPSDCIPVPGAEGPLGDLLDPHRGSPISAPLSTLTSSAETPCRDAVDLLGRPSTETVVHALFDTSLPVLAEANLAAFPTEIAALLDGIRLDSLLTVELEAATNTYRIQHQLSDVSFPDAQTALTLGAFELALPVWQSPWMQTSLTNQRLTIPRHGFTLRLGTASRYAFEVGSLGTRGFADIATLVKSMFLQAQLTDQGNTLTGCDALDAVLCDQIMQPRSCFVRACQDGLAALAQKLSNAFAGLDGSALDFFLSGYATVVDLDGDGTADVLGMAANPGQPQSGPGLWSAEIQSRTENVQSPGVWTASRRRAPP